MIRSNFSDNGFSQTSKPGKFSIRWERHGRASRHSLPDISRTSISSAGRESSHACISFRWTTRLQWTGSNPVRRSTIRLNPNRSIRRPRPRCHAGRRFRSSASARSTPGLIVPTPRDRSSISPIEAPARTHPPGVRIPDRSDVTSPPSPPRPSQAVRRLRGRRVAPRLPPRGPREPFARRLDSRGCDAPSTG